MPTKKQKPGRVREQPPSKPVAYPKHTEGSEWAARIREETNSLNEAERAELFRQGMQIVYGGAGKKQKARARH